MKRLLLLFLFVPVLCFAQSFGFDDVPAEGGSSLPFSFEFGGEIEAGPVLFVNDFKGGENAEAISVWDFINAYASFDINGKNAQAFIGLNLSYGAFEELEGDIKDGPAYPPALIDEMWLRAYFDRINVQAGFIKLRWGRMYSPGPLDIANPLDYSDLTGLTESKDMKIARPMIHASYNFGEFSSVEAVFLPNFAGHKFDLEGRWAPAEYTNAGSVFKQSVFDRALRKYPQLALLGPGVLAGLQAGLPEFSPELPGMSTPDFFQAGLRLNTVIGSSDFGFQYFYGNDPRPSVSIEGVDNFIDDLAKKLSSLPPNSKPDYNLLSPHIEYTRYHQIGIDYSQVLFGFTIRAEFAAHITGDVSGDDGNVRNPFLAWAFGFDRDIFAGININVQCNETIRLLDDKVGENRAMDCEAGTSVTSTRLILQISKSFFMERLECKVVNIWDIEDSGLVIIPSIAWSVNDTRIELSAGIFTGDEASELGQYCDNSYIKLIMTYSF